MLVFLLIVLSVYGLVNFYIFRRGLQALAAYPRGRWIFIAVFLALVLAYPAGRMLVGLGRNSAAGLVVKAGSLHLALMIYLLLGVIVIDLCRLVNSFWPIIPKAWASRPGQTGVVLFLLVAGASLLVIIGGAVNAARPRLRELAISIDKSAGSRRGLTIVMASDVHLGTIAGSARLKMLVDRANALDPDIVLLPGDIVDESVTAGEEEEMTAVFRKIRAPLGVFSVPGNHEYYGGLERNLAYLREWGVKVLQDEAVLVDGSFYIIGRRDPTALRRGELRMPIGEIMKRGEVD
ncbi:MAG: metallophosphoesterase, partial [Candidatus Aminicenantales bacterium]